MSEEIKSIPQFILTGATSGSGKTTISVGLMRLLTERGFRVGAFKCGPDYIDTQFHRIACGRPSVNLDLFMSSERGVKELYSSKISEADVAIVEGVMGMYDGYEKWHGSSAHLSKVLKVPVVLIVNGASVSYSVGALIKGFRDFIDGIEFGGVIFNNVSSESHFKLLKQACDDIGAKCFGYVRKTEELNMPSRHLGLKIGDWSQMDKYISRCAGAVSEGVDIDSMLQTLNRPIGKLNICGKKSKKNKKPLTIAIAHDEAFSFIYESNLEAWRNHERYDVTLKFFSPMNDAELPECDLLYLPGGYPELYSERLAENRSMKESIARFCRNGGNVLAECGGMIYLCKSIDNHELCGVLPMRATMSGAKLHLGYRNVKIERIDVRGHEFHYSRLMEENKLPSVGMQFSARGKEVATEVFRQGNVIAGYTHLYWAENDILKLWDL